MKKHSLLKILGLTAVAAGAVVYTVADVLYKVAFDREKPKISDAALGASPDYVPTDAEKKRMALEEETADYVSKQQVIDLYITSEDGLKLYGGLLPAEHTSLKNVIVVHGFRGNANGDFGGMIQFYHKAGYNVLMIDDRAHRKSEGEYLGFGWKDRRDLIKWCSLLKTLYGEEASIALHGVSMGAAAVMCTSGEADLPEQVKCFVEDCGFSSIEAQFTHVFPKALKFMTKPVLFVDDLISRRRNGFSLKEASSVKQLRKNKKPMLFIHGGADDFVPTAMVFENYNASAGEKELYIEQSAKHACAYAADPETYEKTVGKFLEKYM